jgi:hypothetical protein
MFVISAAYTNTTALLGRARRGVASQAADAFSAGVTIATCKALI